MSGVASVEFFWSTMFSIFHKYADDSVFLQNDAPPRQHDTIEIACFLYVYISGGPRKHPTKSKNSCR